MNTIDSRSKIGGLKPSFLMSLPPTEPIKETLKNLKMNIPLMEDKELLANSKYLLVNWRRWNMRSNFLQLYLYKDEMISRLPNFSFIRKILFRRRFNLSINETKKFFDKRKLNEADLNNKIKEIIK